VGVKRVIKGAHHRNGIGGAPFHVIQFESDEDDSKGAAMIGVVFDEPGCVAVFRQDLLAVGCIEFGKNSWRGDRYEGGLRAWIRRQEPMPQCDDCRHYYDGPVYYTLGTDNVFGDGKRCLVHDDDGTSCTGNLCPRCAGPYLEPDAPGDERRPIARHGHEARQ
jgi:hypothetical protein